MRPTLKTFRLKTNMIGEIPSEALESSAASVARLQQCMALARIFRQSADDARGDRSRSARYWQVALQYDAEATRHEHLLAIRHQAAFAQ